MTVIEIDYIPNSKQELFHISEAEETLYGGAKGGGKSCGLVMEALAYGLEHAGATIYLFRETFDDLEANLVAEMKAKWDERLYTYNEGKYIATLINGTKVFFRYIRNWKDANKYQGRSIDFIGVDELTKHEERSIQVLLSCLRSPKGFPPRFRATCNPNGIGFGWVKRRYIDGTNYGKEKVVDEISGNVIEFIPATVYDNTVLMENDPAYIRRLENLPEDERRAFLLGDWDSLQGQYFTMYRRDKHVIEPFEIPDYWKRYRSIDWGFNDHCAVYWHAVDSEGRTYTYKELYINETLASDVAKKIVEMSKDEDIQYTVASPDMWQNRGAGVKAAKTGEVIGKSIAETFLENGVPLIQADNARVIGWQRMAEVMSDQADGKPNWIIFSNCFNLIRTLPYLVRDERKPEDIGDRQEDHPAESCRYFFMSRPISATTPKEKLSEVARHKQALIKRIRQARIRPS